MNLVFASPFLLGDLGESGGVNEVRGFAQGLAERHNVHIIAFDLDPTSPDSVRSAEQMRRWAATVEIVPLHLGFGRKLSAKLQQLLLRPEIVTLNRSAAYRQACRRILAAHSIDLAIMVLPFMAQYAAEFSAIPRILDVVDVFTVSSFREFTGSADRGRFAQTAAFFRWLLWLRFERQAYTHFDHLFVISTQDNHGLRVFSPSLPLSTLPPRISFAAAAPLPVNAPFDVGFIAAYSHKPNVIGLDFFFDRVLPVLKQQLPSVRILIAGKNPPPHLVERNDPAVHFAGFLPTVESFFAQSKIVMAPLLSGGGIKIKVMEGLLSGRPVVTTSIGAEGLDLVDGEHALIADTPDAFARAIVRLAADPALRDRLGAAGKAHIADLGSAEQQQRVVEKVFAQVCAAHPSTQPADTVPQSPTPEATQ